MLTAAPQMTTGYRYRKGAELHSHTCTNSASVACQGSLKTARHPHRHRSLCLAMPQAISPAIAQPKPAFCRPEAIGGSAPCVLVGVQAECVPPISRATHHAPSQCMGARGVLVHPHAHRQRSPPNYATATHSTRLYGFRNVVLMGSEHAHSNRSCATTTCDTKGPPVHNCVTREQPRNSLQAATFQARVRCVAYCMYMHGMVSSTVSTESRCLGSTL